jgi:hypothetical protein
LHEALSGAPAMHLSWAQGHAPQSAGQLVHVSPVSQVPLPHTAVAPLLLADEDALVDDDEALVEEDEALVDDDEALVDDDEEEVVTASPLDELLEISPLELLVEGPAPCPLVDEALLVPGAPPRPAPPSPWMPPPWAQPATAANAAATLNKAR